MAGHLRSGNTIAGYCLLAIITFGGDRSWASPIVGDPSLFSRIVGPVSANLQRLHTWQGRAEITRSAIDAAGQSFSREVIEVNFACDRDHDAVRWNLHAASGTIAEQPIHPYFTSGMLWGGKIYRLQPYAVGPRPAGLTLLIEPRPAIPASGIDESLDEFSPMAYFPQVQGDTAKALQWYKVHSADKDLIGGTISDLGDRIVFELSEKAGPAKGVNRYEFSKNQGWNLTREFLGDDVVQQAYTISYQHISGVFVPSSYTSTYHTARPSPGQPSSTKTEVQFLDPRLNSPITFSLQLLGLRPGDDVYDRASGLDYIYSEPTSMPGSTP
ncbi:MAG TPA: hypothetical protein VMD30_12750 [Tepidisphaeraceae bacterium]|nr:hypothetical protein [Tepidisphaeraceae bacterium]